MLKKKTDIVILGAGIAGYEAFYAIKRHLFMHRIKKKITLIDKNNYFTFTPMLHEVASGSVQSTHCAIPARECTYDTPHEFWQAKVKKVIPEKKLVKTSEGEIQYKYCVIALGSKTNYFGVKGARKHSFNVRSLVAASKLHQRFIELLEDKSKPVIDMAIVGGGATGVELAGQFDHLDDHDLKALYPEQEFNVKIVQAGDRILKFNHPKTQKAVIKKLKKDGVEVLLNSQVSEVTKNSVKTKDGRKIHSDITVWTAGFTNEGATYIDEKYCDRGLIKINENLQIPEHPEIFAIGDLALCINPDDETLYPKLGEIAHAQGAHLGGQFCRIFKKKPLKPFKHKLKGALIPIGDWWAAANLGKVHFSGRIAWWIRRTVYLAFIPGFLRKLRIVIDWTIHSLGFRHIVNIDLDSEE
jgi:NADH:ubiquinone reductase (H+-translocating)